MTRSVIEIFVVQERVQEAVVALFVCHKNILSQQGNLW
jgi:hypothetical protein